jgi:ribonucleoside-diphosphate reductase alpha chain
MSRITSLEQMKRAVELGTAFLTAGTVYSDVPYEKISTIREKNRRLGLGLMGLHDWLMTNGKTYGADAELAKYMEIYQQSGAFAKEYADKWNLSTPVKTRAVAPTGSIGIIGETTTGIEPVFCVAYKRRYLKDRDWHYQYVVDPTADRLIANGMDPEKIEDAVTISYDVERRVAFQAWVQKYVDHAISSTINLPAWGTENNNESKVKEFGNMLMKYLPDLRGVTCYPDGARDGQPLTRVKYSTAVSHVGKVFVEGTDICDITKQGSCG